MATKIFCDDCGVEVTKEVATANKRRTITHPTKQDLTITIGPPNITGGDCALCNDCLDNLVKNGAIS